MDQLILVRCKRGGVTRERLSFWVKDMEVILSVMSIDTGEAYRGIIRTGYFVEPVFAREEFSEIL
jgi:hypothetical protein